MSKIEDYEFTDICNVNNDNKEQYQWVDVAFDSSNTDTYICDGTKLHYVQKKQVREDEDAEWVDVEPIELRKSYVADEFSELCGYVPLERWEQRGFICYHTRKYAKEYKQMSYDNGQTWFDSEPLEVQIGSKIADFSQDCFNYANAKNVDRTLTFMEHNNNYDIVHDDNYYFKQVTYTNSEYTQETIDSNVFPDFISAADFICNVVDLPQINETTQDNVKRVFQLLNYNTTVNLDHSSFSLRKLNTENMTDFSDMFFQDKKNVDDVIKQYSYIWGLGNINTSKGLKFDNMFRNMRETFQKRNTISFPNFDTSKATSMKGMFQDTIFANRLDISNFDFTNVTDFSYMFDGTTLNSLILPTSKPTNVTNVENMFRECYGNQEDVDLSDWGTSGVTSLFSMFDGANRTNSINLSNWDVSHVTNMYHAFNMQNGEWGNKPNYLVLDGWHLDSMDLSEIDETYQMFNPLATYYNISLCNSDAHTYKIIYKALKQQNLLPKSEINTCEVNYYDVVISNITPNNSIYLYPYFSASSSNRQILTADEEGKVYYLDLFDSKQLYIDVLNPNDRIHLEQTNEIILGDRHISNISLYLEMINLENISFSGTKLSNLFINCGSLKEIQHLEKIDECIKDSLAYSFSSISVPSLDLSFLNVSGIQIANFCFADNLAEEINISNWDTSSITTATNFLQGAYNLKTLNSFETLNVFNLTNMNSMFDGCSSLTSIEPLTNWNTSKVTDMRFMFQGCSSLTSIEPISNWDTSKVTNMNGMFKGCSGLTSVNLSNFSFATNKTDMFADCPNLTKLNISNSSIGSFFDFFDIINCQSLTELTADNITFNTWGSAHNFMFSNCSGLTKISLNGIDGTAIFGDDYLGNIFRNCTNLIEVSIQNWNMTDVVDVNALCFGCTSLQSINMTNTDISNVDNIRNIFYDCTSLQHITCTQATKDKLMTLNTTSFPTKNTVQWTIVG